MEKHNVYFHFHNPNTVEATAGYLLKIFMEANKGKVELAMQAASEMPPAAPAKRQNAESHSA